MALRQAGRTGVQADKVAAGGSLEAGEGRGSRAATRRHDFGSSSAVVHESERYSR